MVGLIKHLLIHYTVWGAVRSPGLASIRSNRSTDLPTSVLTRCRLVVCLVGWLVFVSCFVYIFLSLVTYLLTYLLLAVKLLLLLLL